MFHKLHYYDFYHDDRFWDYIAGRGRMRKRGLSKAVAELPLYGYSEFGDRGMFDWNYGWCRSRHVEKSVRLFTVYYAKVLLNLYTRWDARVCFMEGDRRLRSIEGWNPFDRLAKEVYCFIDSEGNHYAKYYFEYVDDECDGYAIEVASVFNFGMDRDEYRSMTAYTFRMDGK